MQLNSWRREEKEYIPDNSTWHMSWHIENSDSVKRKTPKPENLEDSTQTPSFQGGKPFAGCASTTEMFRIWLYSNTDPQYHFAHNFA